MWFKVYTKAQDTGFMRDYYWAWNDEEPTIKDERGPYPLRSFAWIAGLMAWIKSHTN